MMGQRAGGDIARPGIGVALDCPNIGLCAGKIAYVSDDSDAREPGGTPPVASIAAERARRRHPAPGPPGPAGPVPADLAERDTGALATAPQIAPQPDSSDVLRRLEHAAAGDGVIARLGEIMARITADDPATAAFWASLADTRPTAGTE
jgi:hypothetical protein